MRLGEGENRALQEGDFLSFGGAKLLRQAHRDYDEPNPFLFKLTDMHRLFTQALPSAVPDNQPATLRHSTAGEVIDLTVSSSSPYLIDLSSDFARKILPSFEACSIFKRFPEASLK